MNHVFLCSLEDFSNALRKQKKIIFLFAIFSFLLVGIYGITRPITYEAEGCYKHKASKGPDSTIVNVLSSIARETYIAQENPIHFLKCKPVLQKVSKRLHLQGYIFQKTRGEKIKNIFNQLKLRRFFSRNKQKNVPSEILSKNQIIPTHKEFNSKKTPLSFSLLEYTLPIRSSLKVEFSNERQFVVFQNNKPITNGFLGELIYFPGGKMKLESTQTIANKSKFYLSLIPESNVVNSLFKQLKVMRDPENPNLINLTFQHQNPKLAAAIVNQTLKGYQDYLYEQAKDKIDKQLLYLEQRKNEILAEIDTMLSEHEVKLSKDVAEQKLFSIDHEIEILAQKQIDEKMRFYEIEEKIQLLLEQIQFEGSLEDFYQSQSLSQAIGKEEHEIQHFINTLQNEKTDTLLRLKLCEDFRDPIQGSDLSFESIGLFLRDPKLSELCSQMTALQEKALDHQNYSQKERATFKQLLESEKTQYQQYINRLQSSLEIKNTTIAEQLKDLYKDKLSALFKKQQHVMQNLEKFHKTLEDFPRKWMEEQKTNLSCEMYENILKSILVMVETKKSEFHLDHTFSSPFVQAVEPIVPNPPKGLLFFTIGPILTLGIFATYFFTIELLQGPTASHSNMLACGFRCTPSSLQPETIENMQLKQCIGLYGGHLQKHLEKFFQNSKILFISVSFENHLGNSLPFLNIAEKRLFLHEDPFDNLHLKEEIDDLKEQYETIIFTLEEETKSHLLAMHPIGIESWIYHLTDERIKHLSLLPENIHYIAPQVIKKLSLQDALPLVDQLLQRRSFSFKVKEPLRKWFEYFKNFPK